MNLIGDNNIAKIDDKGRLMIPAVFKKRLLNAGIKTFVLKKELNKQCLYLYPITEWQKKEKYLNDNLSEFNPQHELYISLFYKDVVEVDMDGTGRIAIPSRLKAKVNIDREVLVKGRGKLIELWMPEECEKEEISPEMYVKLGEAIFGNKL